MVMYWEPIWQPFNCPLKGDRLSWPSRPKMSALTEPEVWTLFQHNADHMIFLLTFQGWRQKQQQKTKQKQACLHPSLLGGLWYLLPIFESPVWCSEHCPLQRGLLLPCQRSTRLDSKSFTLASPQTEMNIKDSLEGEEMPQNMLLERWEVNGEWGRLLHFCSPGT